ncbi:hypothetical protein L210DRAFT_3550755 [Boletus edulis BED1]|uniref:Uncharacterized protein n=1 Tax=Boletus edulis BED1 TaxID=1328754 RepID=A0AAD4BNT2_BOLED|nr:hypothetical protein L210DRAFT_3550755 [Boletus edulis BED1]
MMSTSRYAFQSPSASEEKGAYRMRPPRASRAGSNLSHSSEPSSRVHLHVPYRRTRRLAMLVALLACGALACFVCAYWLFKTRYGYLTLAHTKSEGHDAPHAPYHFPNASHQFNISLDTLDESDARLNALRTDPATTYLAYLPHSGLHNQRIALENALTLAYLLNRTLLVPPARLGPKTLRYVRSSTLARMLRLSDKRQGRGHCARIPQDVPQPDECVDYMAYTFIPWAWLVDLQPLKAQQGLVQVLNGTAEWIEEMLDVRRNETLLLHDTEPYQYQFVDTPAPVREGDKYLHTIHVDTLAAAPQRLIQLGTLFGSSRLRLRKTENRRVRGERRRHMVFANAALTFAAAQIRGTLGGTYVGAHVRVGDGRFQKGTRESVRVIWWKLVWDVLGVNTQMAFELEKRISSKIGADGEDEDGDMGERPPEMIRPPEIPADVPSLRVPHSPLPPLPETFSPKLSCRSPLHTMPGLRRLNVPLFIATDAPDGLDDSVLAPLIRAFPCTFTLESFKAETAHLEGLRNGYDGVRLVGYLAPMVDALVMGGAWGVVGTEGSTFSRYVADVLWRVSHGWDIVERG